jgi:NADH-quinone oxidoreductase subunit G
VITLIFRLISKAIDNEFSGNMIDVCPVGALTDKTFRLNREFGSTSRSMRTENVHTRMLWKTTVWMFGNEIQRVTGRKDVYHEVEEFICNSCRFDHKEVTDWVIEGKSSTKTLLSTKIIILRIRYCSHCYRRGNLEGREQDRKKISMPAFPLGKNKRKILNKVIFNQWIVQL